MRRSAVLAFLALIGWTGLVLPAGARISDVLNSPALQPPTTLEAPKPPPEPPKVVAEPPPKPVDKRAEAAARKAKADAAKKLAAKPAPTPQELRLAREREEYRVRLIANLKQKQAVETVQVKLLEAQQNRLKTLREQLITLTNAPADDSGSSSDSLTPEVPQATKVARQYDVETYRTIVVREALMTTRKEIVAINGFLKNVEQR